MQVADVIGSMLGSDLPIRVLGYDGSKAGPDTAETASEPEAESTD